MPVFIIIDHNKYKLRMNSQRTHVGSYKVIKEILCDQRQKLTKVCNQELEYLIRSFPIMTSEVYQQSNSQRKCDKLMIRCLKYIDIDHPYIQKITSVFLEEQLKMMYIHVVVKWSASQGDLLDFIENRKHLHKGKLKKLMLGLASAVREMHSENIIHNNITLRTVKRQGVKYKLILPCLHEIAQFQKKHLGYENMEHDYLSHQIANNDGYDIAVDVWSLGILFLQLITGVPLLVGSAQKQVMGNIQELIKALPNKQCLQLIKGMLEPIPIFRLTIEEVEQILQSIHFRKYISQTEQEKRIDRLYEVFSLSLFRDRYSNLSYSYTNFLHKSEQSQQILETHEIKNKFYSVLVNYDNQRDLIVLYIRMFKYKKIILTQIDFEDVPLKIKDYFTNNRDLFNQIRTCSIQRVKLSSDGTLQFEFDKQRCDILQQIILLQAEQMHLQKEQYNAKNNAEKNHIIRNQENKTKKPDPVYFDPSPTFEKPSNNHRKQEKQGLNTSKFQQKINSKRKTDYNQMSKIMQLYSLARQAYESGRDQDVLFYGQDCIELLQNVEPAQIYKMNTYFWLSKSSQKLSQFTKCYQYAKAGLKFVSKNDDHDQQCTNSLNIFTYKQHFYVSIFTACLMTNNEVQMNKQKYLIEKDLPRQCAGVLFYTYYFYYITMVIHRKIFLRRSPEAIEIFKTARKISQKVRMSVRLANYYLYFANEVFFTGIPEFYDFGIELMTKTYDFIKLDLKNPFYEKIYSLLVTNIMNFSNSYYQPIARSKIMTWVDCNAPHLKEVVTATETIYPQNYDF